MMDRSGLRAVFAIVPLFAVACATSPQTQQNDTYIDTGVLPDTLDTITDTGTGEPDGPSCSGTETLCGDTCVDTDTDVDHCGTCDNACTTDGDNMEPTCIGGTCGAGCIDGYWDLDDEVGCEYPCTYAAGIESCNGVDDNCDGNRDEGFPCTFAEETPCTTTCSTLGTGVCGMDCSVPAPAACTPPEEACNGIDDDCDGETDEDWPPGTCGTCVPDCTGRDCGLEPVCYTSCGDCDPATEICTSAGLCECVPDCLGRECGPDPNCSDSCGTCTGTDICDASGHCVASCTPDCSGRVCGPDPVCSESCGTCTGSDTCNAMGQCIPPCTPDCSGRVCGPDPTCGFSCGTCTGTDTCNAMGQCIPACTPDCTGRTCGPDPLCGISCGTCTSPAVCDTTGNCSTCTETPCGLVPNCGCPTGQKCSLVSSGGTPTRACVSEGYGTKGSSCVDDADCAAGYICVTLSSDYSSTEAACYPFCNSSADCTGDASLCYEAFSGTTDQICSLGCNLVTSAGCPSGSKCALYTLTATGEPLTDCTADVGIGGLDYSCLDESYCASGFFCDAGVYECLGYCSISPTDSCSVWTCEQFVDSLSSPVSIVFDGVSYGYCYDPF